MNVCVNCLFLRAFIYKINDKNKRYSKIKDKVKDEMKEFFFIHLHSKNEYLPCSYQIKYIISKIGSSNVRSTSTINKSRAFLRPWDFSLYVCLSIK